MPNDESDSIFHDLRRLAAEDPLKARERFLYIFDNNETELDNLLELALAPGEGRLRQLIANAVRIRKAGGKISQHLILWQSIETDEFAKRAINAALKGVTEAIEQPSKKIKALSDPNLVEAHRYAAGRLQHRVRNALLRPSGQLILLQRQLTNIENVEVRANLESILGSLRDSFRNLGHIVEAFEVGDEHFKLKSVLIPDWLETMNLKYAREYSTISLTIHINKRIDKASLRIQANDYLLETVFWNIWINAHQATKGECQISVYITCNKKNVELLIVDSGYGFERRHVGIAFDERFSSRGVNRGRGLLEVQEAVERLQGTVGLVEYQPGQYRIKILFPQSI